MRSPFRPRPHIIGPAAMVGHQSYSRALKLRLDPLGSGRMGRIEEFLRNAEEAERRASTARTAAEREAYLKIADGWRQLAGRRGIKGEPPTDRS